MTRPDSLAVMETSSPLYAAAGRGVSEAFARRVDRLAQLYFDEILPRFIDRHYRGRGYELIARMMEVHDGGLIRGDPQGPPPSKRALRLAAGAALHCPLSISAQPYMKNLAPVLGEFRRIDFTTFEGIGTVRSVDVACEVVLFEHCFSMAGVTEERLDDEIVLTIFHEYIHYIESFLPARDRPLANREAGISMPPNDVARARRRDRLYVARLWSVGLGFVAASAALAYVLTPS